MDEQIRMDGPAAGAGYPEEYVEIAPPEDWTDRIVGATPWWAISIGVHGLFLLLAIYVVMGSSLPPMAEEVAMLTLPAKPLERPPVVFKRDVFDNRKIVRAESAVEDPVFIKDAEEAKHNETANDEEFKEAKGDSKDFLSDKPFKGTGVNDAIGVGGGPGGKFGGRLGGKRNCVTRGCGSIATESAVVDGLRWLARHQNPDGSWDTDGFPSQCGRFIRGACGGPGYPEYDSGSTSLALLAFLGAGYTHLSRDSYDGLCFGTVVKNGLKWLMANQDGDGCVGGRSAAKYLYNHAIAALALSEAYGLTGSGLFKDNAQRSIDFLLSAQNPGQGWRYTARSGDNDSSVTGWCVMALKSAEISGLRVVPDAYAGARAWFNKVTGADHDVAYNGPEAFGTVVVQGKTEAYSDHDALVAIGMMSRIFIDRNPNDPHLRGGAERLVRDLPVWDGPRIDFYYWYYASLALFQYDGPDGRFWNAWNESMKNALVKSQKKASEGCLNGSWDPIDRWGFEGGRVYATAMNVLTLEVYYRYDNVFVGEKKKTEKKP
jgi:ElaB/YqjD/DUF883 family membrane-anchored ribosome-binding protein